MAEVSNIEEAGNVVVISESFGDKRILKEVYFDTCYNDNWLHKMLVHVAKHYPEYINYNNRIDIYKVINGRKIARV